MYICVCRAVTDRQIHEAALKGAHTLRDLRRLLGVTSECGHCAAYALQCLQEATATQRKPDHQGTDATQLNPRRRKSIPARGEDHSS